MEDERMKLAVLSGKGGAGKTFVSVNLAAAAESARYLDCDVEEPNGHLFFKPERIEEEIVSVLIPRVDPGLCTGCRKCVDFCRFNALAYVKNSLRIFDTVCHSCGGCALICPEDALTEIGRPIGRVQRGGFGTRSGSDRDFGPRRREWNPGDPETA
jgi:MinD superfamily P-loop ATPase